MQHFNRLFLPGKHCGQLQVQSMTSLSQLNYERRKWILMICLADVPQAAAQPAREERSPWHGRFGSLGRWLRFTAIRWKNGLWGVSEERGYLSKRSRSTNARLTRTGSDLFDRPSGAPPAAASNYSYCTFLRLVCRWKAALQVARKMFSSCCMQCLQHVASLLHKCTDYQRPLTPLTIPLPCKDN